MGYIEGMMKKFEAKHMVHMSLYGADNHKRLTGIHETSPFDKFSYGAGNRAASIRIPTQTMNQNGKGYIETEDQPPTLTHMLFLVLSMILLFWTILSLRQWLTITPPGLSGSRLPQLRSRENEFLI